MLPKSAFDETGEGKAAKPIKQDAMRIERYGITGGDHAQWRARYISLIPPLPMEKGSLRKRASQFGQYLRKVKMEVYRALSQPVRLSASTRASAACLLRAEAVHPSSAHPFPAPEPMRERL
jgi:hypothetical protein